MELPLLENKASFEFSRAILTHIENVKGKSVPSIPPAAISATATSSLIVLKLNLEDVTNALSLLVSLNVATGYTTSPIF